MSASQEAITLTIAPGHTVLYSYDGVVNQPTCDLAGPSTPSPDPSVDYVFQLDDASVASHWTMTGHQSSFDPDPLTFVPAPGTPPTSYTVHHPGTHQGDVSWSFEYTNSHTGESFWSHPDQIKVRYDYPPFESCLKPSG